MNRSYLRSLVLLIMSLMLLVNPGQSPAQGLARSATSPDRIKEQRAASLARMGRVEAAVDLYLELLYKNPKNSNLYFRVSSLMPGKAYAPTLLQILDDLLKTQSNNMRLAADRGRLLYIMDRKSEALKDWQGLIDRRKNDRFAYTAVTNAMLQSGAIDEAIQLLTAGRTRLQSPHAFAYDLARIYAAKHATEQAAREYLWHLDQNPGMLDHISNQIIQLLQDPNAATLIEQVYVDILKTPGAHQSIRLSQAKVLLHEQRYADCVQTVLSSDVSRSLKDVLDLADDLSADAAWRQSAELYAFVASHSHNDRLTGEALLKLAASYEHRLDPHPDYPSLGDYFKGNQFLDLDLRIPGQGDAALVRTLKLYDSLQMVLPRTREAFQASYHIAEIQLTVNGDVDRAISGFKAIFRQVRGHDLKFQAGRRLVDAWLVRGDTTAAIQALTELRQTLDLDEDDPRIIASRIRILIHEGAIPRLKKELLNLSGAALPADPLFNDGLELSSILNDNGPDDDPLLQAYLKAEGLLGQHKLTEAVDILQQLSGGPETIADEARVRAIQVLLALHKNTAAAAEMDQFLAAFPESDWRATVLVWRGEQFQYVQHDPAAAIPYYEELIVEHPGFLKIQQVRSRLRKLIGADL